MKNITTIIAALVLTTLSINSFAQSGNSETAQASASATIIIPINIEQENDLQFGTIAKTTNGGTVTIAPQESLDIDYSPEDMETSLTARSAAKFNISGEEDATFSISIPETITLAGQGSNSMIISTTQNLSSSHNTLTGGSVVLYVGGTLTVGEDQAVGLYGSTFNVTVMYE